MPARRPDVPRYALSYRIGSLLSASALSTALGLTIWSALAPDPAPPEAPPALLAAAPRAGATPLAATPTARATPLSLPAAQPLDEPPVHAAGAGGVDVPLLVHQARPTGADGLAFEDRVVTVGIPFEEGLVPQTNGRPALGVAGSSRWQTTTLDTWDDGSVRWALVDAVVDVPAGETVDDVRLVSGPGVSAQTPVAAQTGQGIRANTGPLRLFAPTQLTGQPAPLLYLQAQQAEPGSAPIPLWLVGRDIDLGPVAAGVGTRAQLIHSGPARAVVRVDGPVVDAGGQTLVDFSLYVTLRAGSAEVETTLTVRNASKDRQLHAQLESLGVALAAPVGAAPRARGASPGAPFGAVLGPTDVAFAYQAHSEASTVHTDSPDYLPHLPKLPGSQHEYVQEGYQVNVAGNDLHSLGNPDAYPEHAWLDVTGNDMGVTVSIQRMAYMWPAALEVTGGGVVAAGLFTARNPANYTFVWRQHESRTAVFSFHEGGNASPPASELALVAERLDHPVAARAADYKHYDRAGVFPYRLLTVAEQEQAYAWMGVDHEIEVQNDGMTVMRYIGKSFTGGVNNYALIEDRLVARWLRHGLGGHYLKGLDYALWKSEWQIKRSDGYVYDPDLSPINDDLPHTTRAFGDEEHRYREGIMHAYWLTGDPRYREALYDEAEILKTIEHYQQERSMYQTLRAQALVGEFTDDPILRSNLTERIEWFCEKLKDIEVETEGWGWQTLPDLGSRRYYVNSADNKSEKPPGENFQTRGWITASLGPLGLYHAARVYGPGHPAAQLARGRMRDLSFWTRQELFPFKPDPYERRLPYSYAVTLMDWTITEIYDYHPILLGMAESFVDTGDLTYLKRGVHQVEAFATHDNGPYDDNLYLLDTRPDCQHFFAVYRDWFLGQL